MKRCWFDKCWFVRRDVEEGDIVVDELDVVYIFVIDVDGNIGFEDFEEGDDVIDGEDGLLFIIFGIKCKGK